MQTGTYIRDISDHYKKNLENDSKKLKRAYMYDVIVKAE